MQYFLFWLLGLFNLKQDSSLVYQNETPNVQISS